MTAPTRRPRALIVGLGIAGMATAIRLRQVGWDPVIAERAPGRRTGGYFILLFGTGTASAERLGVLDAIGDRNHPDAFSWEVNRTGRRTKGMSPTGIPGAAGPRLLIRGDVEKALFEALPDDVEIRFSTVPVAIDQDQRSVEVTLRNTADYAEVTERFDLVIGADGMRSTVRRLVFGPEDYLYPLGYMTAVTLLEEPIEGFGPREGLILAEPGRSVWAFPFGDHAPSLLFSYRTNDIEAEFLRSPTESLRAAYGPQPPGPLLEHLFTRYEQAETSLFDSVNQVRMPRWQEGRVVLIGDAAWCVTLYAGMGASSGIAGGELLGTIIARHGDDVPGALREWEGRLRPFIAVEQETAFTMRRLFTPHDRKEFLARSVMTRVMKIPKLSTAFIKLAQRKDMDHKSIDIAAV